MVSYLYDVPKEDELKVLICGNMKVLKETKLQVAISFISLFIPAQGSPYHEE